MPRPTLEEIKLKADAYAKLAKKIAKATSAREAELEPLIEKHNEELKPVLARHDTEIEKLQAKADGIKAEVITWLAPRKKTCAIETGLAIFGVDVGTKKGPRVIDREKFIKLCKKKGVDMWKIVKIMVEKADELLGKKEVTEISSPSSVPYRDAYLKLKD